MQNVTNALPFFAVAVILVLSFFAGIWTRDLLNNKFKKYLNEDFAAQNRLGILSVLQELQGVKYNIFYNQSDVANQNKLLIDINNKIDASSQSVDASLQIANELQKSLERTHHFWQQHTMHYPQEVITIIRQIMSKDNSKLPKGATSNTFTSEVLLEIQEELERRAITQQTSVQSALERAVREVSSSLIPSLQRLEIQQDKLYTSVKQNIKFQRRSELKSAFEAKDSARTVVALSHQFSSIYDSDVQEDKDFHDYILFRVLELSKRLEISDVEASQLEEYIREGIITHVINSVMRDVQKKQQFYRIDFPNEENLRIFIDTYDEDSQQYCRDYTEKRLGELIIKLKLGTKIETLRELRDIICFDFIRESIKRTIRIQEQELVNIRNELSIDQTLKVKRAN